MSICGLHLKEVKKEECVSCDEVNKPDNCIYLQKEPKQITLEVF